jgi:hypothetical protein
MSPNWFGGLGSSGPDESEAAGQKLRLIGPAGGVPACIDALRNPRDVVDEVAALEALKIYGPASEPAVPLLVERLGHKTSWNNAALTLAAIGPAARIAIPTLTKVVTKKRGFWDRRRGTGGLTVDVEATLSTALALAKIDRGNKLALETLVYAVRSDSREVSTFAIRYLEQIGPDAKPVAPTIA